MRDSFSKLVRSDCQPIVSFYLTAGLWLFFFTNKHVSLNVLWRSLSKKLSGFCP